MPANDGGTPVPPSALVNILRELTALGMRHNNTRRSWFVNTIQRDPLKPYAAPLTLHEWQTCQVELTRQRDAINNTTPE